MGTSEHIEGIDLHKVCVNTQDAAIRPVHLATGGTRMEPSAFLIGAQKAGTSSLYKELIGHNQVIPSHAKEIYFFNNRNNFELGLNWYRGHFATKAYAVYSKLKNGKAIAIDGTANYLESPEAPSRLKSIYPDARIIVMLRDPVERAFSHYKMAVGYGFEHLTFEEALDQEQARLNYDTEIVIPEHGHGYLHQRLAYRSKGQYVEQLRWWLDQFQEDQMMIIQSESFFRDPMKYAEPLSEFLQIGALSFSGKWANKGIDGEMKDETREQLIQHYRPYNQQLFELLGTEYDWQ